MFVCDASTLAGSFVLRRLGGDASIVGKHCYLALVQTVISNSRYSPKEKVKYLLFRRMRRESDCRIILLYDGQSAPDP